MGRRDDRDGRTDGPCRAAGVIRTGRPRRRKGARLLVLAGALAGVAGCDFVRDPLALEPTGVRVHVHSLVVTGTEWISVLLTRPFGDATVSPSEIARVSGATVRVDDGEWTYDLEEAAVDAPPCFAERISHSYTHRKPPPGQAGEGCYSVRVPGGVRPGVRYTLDVELPDGGTATGVTTAPPALTLEAPESGLRRRLGGDDPDTGYVEVAVPTRWRGGPSSGLTEVAVVGGTVFRDGEPLEDAWCNSSYGTADDPFAQPIRSDTATSVVIRVATVVCDAPWATGGPIQDWDSVHTRVRVVAYDSAYARYDELVLGTGSVTGAIGYAVAAPVASVGLDGAVGVFAGAAAASRRVTFLWPHPRRDHVAGGDP